MKLKIEHGFPLFLDIDQSYVCHPQPYHQLMNSITSIQKLLHNHSGYISVVRLKSGAKQRKFVKNVLAESVVHSLTLLFNFFAEVI